jgi:hypothetical protein
VVQALPASTFSAAGSVTVALRATAEIGTTLQIPVINQELTMELGAFIEIARYKVVFAPSPNCSMGATESLDLDVGLCEYLSTNFLSLSIYYKITCTDLSV